MGKKTDIHRILVIGAGPIVIGQACEFDYSGSQACKALREEGYQVILANSNPATIMTDPDMADKTYIEPLTVEVLEKIIAQERPDAVLPTLGGQTGLNLAIELYDKGIFDQYNVKMIGADANVIRKAEDREAFKKAIDRIGLASARSAIAYTIEEAREAAKKMGYPCVVRPAFTLGGDGGGIVHNREELDSIASVGLQHSLIAEVLIEESVIGWKEYELEVMRDKKDNVVIVCAIENLDPMGVHTGDSITVAPAQTLTDKEYQRMRDAAIAIMREIGVETGGANVQFAMNPQDGRMIVIEMNPRVSRSSALASKATGFPIAKFAAKLAVGYTLDEIQNDITKKTLACFEPTIDYVVTKLPRFNFEKFKKTAPVLGTSMKSVGEVMSIGRTFKESLQKGLRSLEIKRGGLGFDGNDLQDIPIHRIIEKLEKPNPIRLFYIQLAFEKGVTLTQIHHYTGIDPWFLYQIQQIVEAPKGFTDTYGSILEAKQLGFSDRQLAHILSYESEMAFRQRRKELGIKAVYKLVDTCAGEFESYTPYYYSTYEQEDEVEVNDNAKVMILGGGPSRIGQGIEFDYCCVHAAFASQEEGYESIMVNSNPETVSTDFDISDQLYFEPLTFEDVLNIYEKEKPIGVIVQFGGQTPLNIAKALEKAGVKILGTSSDSIDNAEDRARFKQLLQKLHLEQPPNATVSHTEEATPIAQAIGYPVVVRPSYVLGGASMELCFNEEELRKYIQHAKDVSPEHPILIDGYLKDAIEVDVDALADGTACVIAGIMEHVEPAGIHSGDSACSLPPYSLSESVIHKIKEATKALAKELQVVGLLNIQFAVKDESLYVIEVNPRASRTIPFVSKATGIQWAKMAMKVIVGKTIAELGIKEVIPPFYSVKEAVLPFNKFPAVDPVCKLEMRSTGEVMGIDPNFYLAYYKAQRAANQKVPLEGGSICFSIQEKYLSLYTSVIQLYRALDFHIITTVDIKGVVKGNHITFVNNVTDIITKMDEGTIKLLISPSTQYTPPHEVKIRQAALQRDIPIITTLPAASITAHAIKTRKEKALTVTNLQHYYQKKNYISYNEGFI
ncbi:MAG: carbamoyl-phosphate synthase large subunit [Cytophagales bacterium]|nr:carbamoyl-phosphate synthase large subunit [Cytophagales bacterium]